MDEADMSATRDKARQILDAALPENKIITSNGATADKYAEMTGLTHKRLTDNWASGGIMTGCNGFTGWYGTKMGSRKYLGGFDLKKIVKDAGKENAWIKSTQDNRPRYGDILRHASFHVDVSLDFDGDVLIRAAGGQGGKAAGCDIIKRVRGKSSYNPSALEGWIDIDIYFGDDTQPALVPDWSWLIGWWEVKDRGETYYYYFFPSGIVQYTTSPALLNKCPNLGNEETGKFGIDQYRNIAITWNVPDYPREAFSPADSQASLRRLTGTLPDYPTALPFPATKIGR
jgi:hypothetical protein